MNNAIPEIEEIYESSGSGEPLWLFCKGHYSVEAFLKAVEKLNRDEGLDYQIEPYDVQHEYARNVPIGKGQKGYGIHLSKPGRGAYPITYVDLV